MSERKFQLIIEQHNLPNEMGEWRSGVNDWSHVYKLNSLFVGLSHVQHIAAYFLLRYTANVAFPCTQSLAKASIWLYSVKIMSNTAEDDKFWYLRKYCTQQNIVTAQPH